MGYVRPSDTAQMLKALTEDLHVAGVENQEQMRIVRLKLLIADFNLQVKLSASK